jgi:hypothetical protein
MGDLRQILPIVKGGSASDTIRATFVSSTLWDTFKKYSFSVNMRILSATALLTNDSTEAERMHVQQQTDYARFILCIGEGKEGISGVYILCPFLFPKSFMYRHVCILMYVY